MVPLFLLLHVQFAASQQLLLLVHGLSTPPELMALIQVPGPYIWLPSNVRVISTATTNFARLEALALEADGVVDCTFSTVEKEMLAGICDLSQVPHIVIGYFSHLKTLEWTYYVNGRESDLADALEAVKEHFG